ncbi:hypothetical protein SPI_05496 [Niveomyces insectorum RCEF 264]|uniref:Uncharacterized protein n=1 Tax=Niveomyces insectorum RCEF 264 TaxID=1081102 RepID=A0A167T9Y3_9HYPO|nr:hypothetical protein SPI_05496 [Niveomyces insectorum RCEF 264]
MSLSLCDAAAAGPCVPANTPASAAVVARDVPAYVETTYVAEPVYFYDGDDVYYYDEEGNVFPYCDPASSSAGLCDVVVTPTGCCGPQTPSCTTCTDEPTTTSCTACSSTSSTATTTSCTTTTSSTSCAATTSSTTLSTTRTRASTTPSCTTCTSRTRRPTSTPCSTTRSAPKPRPTGHGGPCRSGRCADRRPAADTSLACWIYCRFGRFGRAAPWLSGNPLWSLEQRCDCSAFDDEESGRDAYGLPEKEGPVYHGPVYGRPVYGDAAYNGPEYDDYADEYDDEDDDDYDDAYNAPAFDAVDSFDALDADTGYDDFDPIDVPRVQDASRASDARTAAEVALPFDESREEFNELCRAACDNGVPEDVPLEQDYDTDGDDGTGRDTSVRVRVYCKNCGLINVTQEYLEPKSRAGRE